MTIREQHWVDEALPDELRRVLENARDPEAESAQVARLRERLGDVIGPAFAAPHAEPGPVEATAGSRAAHGALIAKLVAPLCLFVLGFGATWWGASGGVRRPSLQPMAARPLALAVTPAAPEPVPDALAAPPAAPEPLPPSAASKPKPRRAPEPDLGLSEELRQLENIRVALERSPERALALADAHQRRFAHGALGPERELLRIDAWLRLGQYQRARTRAEQLLSQPNAHPYRAQITKLLADYRAAKAQRGTP